MPQDLVLFSKRSLARPGSKRGKLLGAAGGGGNLSGSSSAETS